MSLNEKIISAGGIVVNDKNQIILVKERRGSWGFPKGHLEEGESELEAAKREIYEEAGVKDLEYKNELGLLKHIYKSKRTISEIEGPVKYIKMFLFKTVQENLSPIDPQNPDARWFNYEKIVETLRHEEDKDFFKQVLNDFLIRKDLKEF